jgi:cell division inhibitor SepF
MAGAMRKVGVYLGLVEGDERYPEYDDHHEEERREYREEPRAQRRVEEPAYREEPQYREERRPAPRGEFVGQRQSPAAQVQERRSAPPTPVSSMAVAEPYRITTLHPRTYNEARQIGEQFREGTPVIMNLTEMDDVDAKRLVDFAAGLVFGCHGTIERVTQKVFLLSPANVDVTAEDKARIAEGGFFNQS